MRELRAELPELAPQRQARFRSDYGLSEYDAGLLTGTRGTADYFEDVVGRRGGDAAKEIANWILGDLSRLLNRHHCDIADSPVTPGGLAELLELIADGSLSTSLAKTVSGGYVRHRRWGGRQRARQGAVSNQRYRRHRGRRGRGHCRPPRGGGRII